MQAPLQEDSSSRMEGTSLCVQRCHGAGAEKRQLDLMNTVNLMRGTEESLEKSPETAISNAAVHRALVSRIIVKTEILKLSD